MNRMAVRTVLTIRFLRQGLEGNKRWQTRDQVRLSFLSSKPKETISVVPLVEVHMYQLKKN